MKTNALSTGQQHKKASPFRGHNTHHRPHKIPSPLANPVDKPSGISLVCNWQSHNYPGAKDDKINQAPLPHTQHLRFLVAATLPTHNSHAAPNTSHRLAGTPSHLGHATMATSTMLKSLRELCQGLGKPSGNLYVYSSGIQHCSAEKRCKQSRALHPFHVLKKNVPSLLLQHHKASPCLTTTPTIAHTKSLHLLTSDKSKGIS